MINNNNYDNNNNNNYNNNNDNNTYDNNDNNWNLYSAISIHKMFRKTTEAEVQSNRVLFIS